MFIYIFIY